MFIPIFAMLMIILTKNASMQASVKRNVIIIQLLKPLHRFHSDHWFHMAEYYLSNNNRTALPLLNDCREELKKAVSQNIAVDRNISAASFVTSQYNLCRKKEGFSVIIIIAPPDPRFIKRLTKVAFFLLLLSFTDGKVQHAFVVSHDYDKTNIPGFNNGNFLNHLYLESFFASNNNVGQYDRSKHLVERYLLPRDSSINRTPAEYTMARYINRSSNNIFVTTGGSPIDSGMWFTSGNHVTEMRKKIIRLCSCSDDKCNLQSQRNLLQNDQPEILISRKINGTLLSRPLAIIRSLNHSLHRIESSTRFFGKIYRILIYERDSNRHFQNLEEILRFLSLHTETSGSIGDRGSITWNIDVLYHSDNMHPCLLHMALGEADIFLTTHGFQSTSLIFMKRGAVLIEVFPYKYFKESYLKLSASYGIHHRWLQNSQPTSLSRQGLRFISQKNCMNQRRCRSHARGDSIQVTTLDLYFILNVTQAVQNGTIGAQKFPMYDDDDV
jgi:hypothetical protein